MASNERRTSLDKIAVLRQTGLFGSLPDDVLKKIAGFVVTKRVERGQVLFSEHERAFALYLVVNGEFRSIRQSADGREQVLSTEHAGALLAAAPVLNGGKFFSTMIADTRAEVFCIEERHMYELCSEHTELLWNLARALAHKVRQYAELIEMLALQNVEQRVARYLLTVTRERGVPLADGRMFELTWTPTEIASRLGSVREVVSRAFSHLQKARLIHIEGRRLVVIPDMRTLSRFAGAEQRLEETSLVSDISWEMA